VKRVPEIICVYSFLLLLGKRCVSEEEVYRPQTSYVKLLSMTNSVHEWSSITADGLNPRWSGLRTSRRAHDEIQASSDQTTVVEHYMRHGNLLSQPCHATIRSLSRLCTVGR